MINSKICHKNEIISLWANKIVACDTTELNQLKSQMKAMERENNIMIERIGKSESANDLLQVILV